MPESNTIPKGEAPTVEGLMSLVLKYGEAEHSHQLAEAMDLAIVIEDYAAGLAGRPGGAEGAKENGNG
jgi:hypothetical protein